jgi:hypothetical protein
MQDGRAQDKHMLDEGRNTTSAIYDHNLPRVAADSTGTPTERWPTASNYCHSRSPHQISSIVTNNEIE